MLLNLCLILSLGGCGGFAGDVPKSDNSSGKENTFREDFSTDDRLLAGEENSSSRTEHPDAKQEDELVQSLAATVQIFADGFHGSGIIYEHWEDSVVLVTAAHVIPSGCEEIKIIFGDGAEAACTDYQLMEDTDCAFLIVKEEKLSEDWQEKYGIVKKDREIFDAMQSDDSIFLADYQAENDLGCRFAMMVENWIYVEDFGSHMMLVSGEAHGGMSGCGVFEENGCFLGILCGGNAEGELAVLPYSIIETGFTKLFGENY